MACGGRNALNAKIASLLDELLPVLGAEGVLTGSEVAARASGIWRQDPIAAPVIFRPASTEEVAAVLRACHAAAQTVVTHGGLTGLAEGAIAVRWVTVVPFWVSVLAVDGVRCNQLPVGAQKRKGVGTATRQSRRDVGLPVSVP